MATGKYAKGANDPIGTDVNEILDDDTPKAPTEDKGKRAAGHGSAEEVTISTTCGGDTSTSKPPKRAKISTDDDMCAVMTTGIKRLAKAIEKAGTAETDVPEDLWDNMMDLPGFEEAHLAHYYAHLCENVSLARAFNKLSFSNKLVWVARYISNNNL